jgi:arylsulfatase A-like enzyme
MDQELGRLFDYLKQKDLFHNTVIFFMSDNGASAEGNPTIIPPGRRMGDRGTWGGEKLGKTVLAWIGDICSIGEAVSCCRAAALLCGA